MKKKIDKMSNESTDTVEVNDIKVDGDLYWSDLVTERNKVVDNIIQQQAVVIEMSIRFKEVLQQDEKLVHAINGLVLSIQDLAENVAEITLLHKDKDNNFYTGLAKGDEDVLEYLKIASTYIAIEENLINLIATAHVDIFSKLTTNNTLLSDIKDVKDSVDKQLPKRGDMNE